MYLLKNVIFEAILVFILNFYMNLIKFSDWNHIYFRNFHGGEAAIQNCSEKYLKVVSATFALVYFFNLNESTCQTRKNVFYVTSKALFLLEKIKF